MFDFCDKNKINRKKKNFILTHNWCAYFKLLMIFDVSQVYIQLTVPAIRKNRVSCSMFSVDFGCRFFIFEFFASN